MTESVARVGMRVWGRLDDRAAARLLTTVGWSVGWSVGDRVADRVWESLDD